MTKAISPAQQVRQNLERMTPEFRKALPSHIPVERFIRVAQTAITTNPKLLSADRTSLFAACTKAAECGLMPDGKEAALVPYKDKVQFMTMIAGKMKLARNSGEIKTLDSQIVYKNDKFDYYIDEKGVHINHRPNLFEERGGIVAAYAIGETKDGGVYIEVMTAEQIAAIEKMSSAQNSPWKGPFRSEMIRKSVMNRLLKRMPTSTDIDADIENDHSFIDDFEPIQDEPQPEPIKDAVKKKATPRVLEKMIEEEAPPVIETEPVEETEVPI